MSIRERWIQLIHRAATGSRRTRTLLTPIGVLVFGTFTALFVAAALGVDRLLGWSGLLPASARLAVSIPLIGLGIALTGWSAAHFLAVRGTPVPFNPPPKVVVTGPYRYARNPMLTGVFLFLFGLGFALDSLSLVVFFTPLFMLFNAWEVTAIEEPELTKRLGEEYLVYCKRTPRFLPRLPTDIK